MNRQVLRGRVVRPDAVLDDGVVVVEGDRITFVGPVDQLDGALAEPVGTLLPGLVDIHCHGGGGASFTLGDEAAGLVRGGAPPRAGHHVRGRERGDRQPGPDARDRARRGGRRSPR